MVTAPAGHQNILSNERVHGKIRPAFLGLIGIPDELARVWQDYGVTLEDGGETHSSFTYVVDKKRNLRETFSSGASSVLI